MILYVIRIFDSSIILEHIGNRAIQGFRNSLHCIKFVILYASSTSAATQGSNNLYNKNQIHGKKIINITI